MPSNETHHEFFAGNATEKGTTMGGVNEPTDRNHTEVHASIAMLLENRTIGTTRPTLGTAERNRLAWLTVIDDRFNIMSYVQSFSFGSRVEKTESRCKNQI